MQRFGGDVKGRDRAAEWASEWASVLRPAHTGGHCETQQSLSSTTELGWSLACKTTEPWPSVHSHLPSPPHWGAHMGTLRASYQGLPVAGKLCH